MNHPAFPNFNEVLDSDFACFFLNEKGDTLISRFKESTHIEIDIAKEAIEITKPIKDQGSEYAIIDFTAKFLSITNEAKKYWKENVSPHNTRLVAVVVNDFAIKTMANIYARFDKPRVQTRVFTSIHDAFDWIEDNRP
jgi:hypothetical protein